MGKKGGGFFRGYRPILSSSSGMFARKGDPWMTDREGKKDFDRLVEVENPDMDADRQRHARIKAQSKELQDRVRNPFDAKMTMREAVETEKSIRMDSYHQRVGEGRKLFPEKNKWPEKGKDFKVDTVQRRCANIAQRVKREIRELDHGRNARVHQNEDIGCPRGCGFSAKDSRLVSRHIRKYQNSCCTHSTNCNCLDCRAARNDP